MQKFTVELDEAICKWLVHISEVTGKTVESVIADGIYNQIVTYEDRIYKDFGYSESSSDI